MTHEAEITGFRGVKEKSFPQAVNGVFESKTKLLFSNSLKLRNSSHNMSGRTHQCLSGNERKAIV